MSYVTQYDSDPTHLPQNTVCKVKAVAWPSMFWGLSPSEMGTLDQKVEP